MPSSEGEKDMLARDIESLSASVRVCMCSSSFIPLVTVQHFSKAQDLSSIYIRS